MHCLIVIYVGCAVIHMLWPLHKTKHCFCLTTNPNLSYTILKHENHNYASVKLLSPVDFGSSFAVIHTRTHTHTKTHHLHKFMHWKNDTTSKCTYMYLFCGCRHVDYTSVLLSHTLERIDIKEYRYISSVGIKYKVYTRI